MSEFYVIVIGEDPEADLRKNSSFMASWKESNWLYDGLVLTADYSMEDLATAVAKDARFLPGAVIDNGHWISKDSIGGAWEKNLDLCLKMTGKGQSVNIYTCR